MEPINRYSLEDFTERHRADFDLHEPRPELWEVLEKRLDGEAGGKVATPHLHIAADEPVAATRPLSSASSVQPQLRTSRRPRWQWVGVAAALVVLVVAAGLGERWKSQRAAGELSSAAAGYHSTTEATLNLGADSSVLAASQGGPNGNARLDTAVHGMERYYASQLADRQAQLSQLAPEQAAEWTRELVGLDSSYQQLKRELPRHPQPEMVLTAMNRNLQIRLDILDQQLELRGGDQLARSAGVTATSEYALADSRSVADNVQIPHVR